LTRKLPLTLLLLQKLRLMQRLLLMPKLRLRLL
jgi:hypothetical protein